jgi:rhamnogalacturonan endolyase
MRSLVPLLCCFLLPATLPGAENVNLREDDGFFRISNGNLAATIEKSTARITSVTLGGRELLGAGSGYWSMAASSAGNEVVGFGKSVDRFVSIDPASNGGERAEVTCRFHGTGADASYPGTTEIRYAIDRHSTTLYATAILTHGAGDATFQMREGRFVIKLDSEIFNHLTVDRDRNRVTPTRLDWDSGTPLNLKEARRMTTGAHVGWAEHKYSYSAVLGNVPAYGWLGTSEPLGAWMINPSVEYIAGGPTKMELTAHLDVGGISLPTLLNMWHGSHYGGTVLSLARDENWSKVIGPFAIHFNQGGDPDARWKSALTRAEAERAAWPFPWVRHSAFPPPEARGTVAGMIRVSEPRAESRSPQTMWVGLTAPSYQADQSTVDWQRDGRNYQYWVKAGPDGGFSLGGVRPGTYVLRAFVDGITGEYEHPGIVVREGKTHPVGELVWKPERAGPTLWEIGIPDRSAAEFRNGDQYWHWGNYLKFKTDFPNGVNYIVGRSDWKKDWHICQPLDLSPACEVLGSSTWTVRFPLGKIPVDGTLLRIAFCGSRAGSRLAILLNGSEVGNTGPLPENGTMHRDSHRGHSHVRTFAIPASRLISGENVLQFRLDGRSWHQGVLYDHIRMEEVTAPPTATPEVSGEIDGQPGTVSGKG